MLSFVECTELIKHAEPMLMAMGLGVWSVHVKLEPLDRDGGDRAAGQCKADWRYKRAVIRLDPSHHDSHDGFLNTMRHEMLHLYHAGFTALRDKVESVCPRDMSRLLEENYHDAAEDMVNLLEYMLDQRGLNARELIRRGNRFSRVMPDSLETIPPVPELSGTTRPRKRRKPR